MKRSVAVGLICSSCAFLVVAGLMNTTMRGWRAWYGLVRDGRHTQATVTALNRSQHQQCTFEFSTGGQRLKATDDGCDAGIGEAVAVTYAPSDPTFVTLRDPRTELLTQIGAAVAMAVFAGIVGALQYAYKTAAVQMTGAAQQGVSGLLPSSEM